MVNNGDEPYGDYGNANPLRRHGFATKTASAFASGDHQENMSGVLSSRSEHTSGEFYRRCQIETAAFLTKLVDGAKHESSVSGVKVEHDARLAPGCNERYTNGFSRDRKRLDDTLGKFSQAIEIRTQVTRAHRPSSHSAGNVQYDNEISGHLRF